MPCELTFGESPLKEWHTLAVPIREQVKAKLREQLVRPSSNTKDGLIRG
jgi:hypothetical protein